MSPRFLHAEQFGLALAALPAKERMSLLTAFRAIAMRQDDWRTFRCNGILTIFWARLTVARNEYLVGFEHPTRDLFILTALFRNVVGPHPD